MAANAEYLLSTVDRTLAVRSRGDIEQVAVPVAGCSSFVLKDPLALEYIQLTPTEHFLFDELRSPITLAELKRRFERRFAPQTITHVALQHGINQLFEQGLLMSLHPGHGEQLLERAATRRQRERWQSLLRVLSFRLASWDCTALVERLHSSLRWLYSPAVAMVALAVVAYAVWLALGHIGELFAKLPAVSDLWQPRYLVAWLTTIVVLKAIHELAHAVTCRYFGGQCHEMGVMLLALFPAFYCDVSDVWRMPNKWHRIAIAAAGIVAEIVIAAAAFIAWWHSEPGFLNTWLLGVAIIGSVGTLAINANPLLRYDAHYVLADWLEIPNMGARAQGWIGERLQSWLLGEPTTVDDLLNNRQRRRLAIYAVASRAYSIVIIIAIYAMLYALARPYHLEALITLLAALTVGSIVIPPIAHLGRLFQNPSYRARLRPQRLATVTAMLAAVAMAVLFWPITNTVRGRAVLIPADGHTIYATTGGQLTHVLAPGTSVRAGDVVATLHDPGIELALAEQKGEVAVKRAVFQQVSTLRALDSRLSLKLPTVKAELADAEGQLGQYQRRERELTLRSPVDGVVIAPPKLEREASVDRLIEWSGSPLDERNHSCWIEPGTAVCVVGDPSKLAALVTVDERDVAELQPGETVRILLDSPPVQILEGTVRQVASRATQFENIQSASDRDRWHVVEVEINASDRSAHVGAGGTAKIEASRTTIALLTWNFLKRRLRMPW